MDNLQDKRQDTDEQEAEKPGKVEKSSPPEAANTMADFEDYEGSLVALTRGQYLTGKIVHLDKEGVLVDVGYKYEGFIPLSELSHGSFNHPSEVVSMGDEIGVVVLKIDESEGELRLSKKRADLESAWQRVTKAFHDGSTISGTVVEQVKGGLLVDLGLRGFVPASQVDLRPVKDLSEYVGEALQLKVLELDRARRKVVLSRKKHLEEEKALLKDETMNNLEENQIRKGTVARITNFGVFVNLGGVDGLVHISEMAWKRIKHPSEVVKIGQEVEVMVLKVDKKRERISLSLRQAQMDPWDSASEKFKEGGIYKGRVTKLAKNYVFVELTDGIEGVIPLAELEDDRLVKPDDILKIDDPVNIKVLEVRQPERRIILSLRQAKSDAERGEMQPYLKSEDSGSVKLGDLLKARQEEMESKGNASHKK